MSKCRVLVLSNMYPSNRSKTFGIFVKNQVELLREHDVDVDVIAIDDPRKGKKNVIRKYVKFLLQGCKALLTKGKKYDAVHVHYIFPTGIIGYWFKKILGTKLIVTSHGGDVDQMVKKGERVRNWSKKILDASDHVIVVGEGLKQDLLETFHMSEDKVSVINMGVNREVFKPMDVDQVKEKYKLNKEEKRLLFVGNLIEQKGLTELVEAFHRATHQEPNLSLHLIGEAKDPAYFAQLKEQMATKNIQGVHIHEAMDQPQIAEWMNASDIFILPSHIEGFGLVALEAMACGTPVIGTNAGGLAYLLRDSGIMVDKKNVSQLESAILELVRDPSKQHTLIEKGYEQAEQYDQQTLIQTIIKLYET